MSPISRSRRAALHGPRHLRGGNSSLSVADESTRLGDVFGLEDEDGPDVDDGPELPAADDDGPELAVVPGATTYIPLLAAGERVITLAPKPLIDAALYEPLIERAEDLEMAPIKDAATCIVAEQLFDELKQAEDAIHAAYDGHVDRAYASWNALTTERRQLLEGIELARLGNKKTKQGGLGRLIAGFKARVLEEEARVLRDAEEAARLEQFQTAEREATRAESQGDGALAEEIRQEAKVAPRPILAAAPSRAPATGLTTLKQGWEAGITDWPLLRRAIGEGKYPEFDALLQAALQPTLNALAKTLEATLGQKYPGVEGRKAASLSSRR